MPKRSILTHCDVLFIRQIAMPGHRPLPSKSRTTSGATRDSLLVPTPILAQAFGVSEANVYRITHPGIEGLSDTAFTYLSFSPTQPDMAHYRGTATPTSTPCDCQSLPPLERPQISADARALIALYFDNETPGRANAARRAVQAARARENYDTLLTNLNDELDPYYRPYLPRRQDADDVPARLDLTQLGARSLLYRLRLILPDPSDPRRTVTRTLTVRELGDMLVEANRDDAFARAQRSLQYSLPTPEPTPAPAAATSVERAEARLRRLGLT